jgi:hypothetical protein
MIVRTVVSRLGRVAVRRPCRSSRGCTGSIVDRREGTDRARLAVGGVTVGGDLGSDCERTTVAIETTRRWVPLVVEVRIGGLGHDRRARDRGDAWRGIDSWDRARGADRGDWGDRDRLTPEEVLGVGLLIGHEGISSSRCKGLRGDRVLYRCRRGGVGRRGRAARGRRLHHTQVIGSPPGRLKASDGGSKMLTGPRSPA